MRARSLVFTILRPSAGISLLLLAGCMSGPRPYDGVIGYRAQATGSGFDLTYVDEADVAPEKVLRQLQAVCAARLKVGTAAAQVTVTGEEEFQQDVPMNMAVPVAMQANGGPGGSGPAGVQAKSMVMQDVGVMRLMTLRRTSASCRQAGGN